MTPARQTRHPRMCPNEDCAKHGQETTLMGGCECGAALVAYVPPEPSDDQLECFMAAMGFPAAALLRGRVPDWREGALNFHRLAQRGLNGDERAMEHVARIMTMFDALR